MANQGGLQLLPETRKSITVTIPGENRMLYIGIVFAIISALVAGGLWFLRQQKISELDELLAKITVVNKKIDEKATIVEKVTTLSKQTSVVAQLLKDHIYWTTALSYLESAVSPQTEIDSIQGGLAKKEIVMTVFSSSFTAIAKQIASFNSDPNIVRVEVGKINVETTGRLKYSINLTVNKEYLKYK